jgi:hypothetical protein
MLIAENYNSKWKLTYKYTIKPFELDIFKIPAISAYTIFTTPNNEVQTVAIW